MKEEEIMELGRKLNINEPALKEQYKQDKKAAEASVTKAAKFMGIIKK